MAVEQTPLAPSRILAREQELIDLDRKMKTLTAAARSAWSDYYAAENADVRDQLRRKPEAADDAVVVSNML